MSDLEEMFCLVPVHTHVAECVWNGGHICLGGGGRGAGGGEGGILSVACRQTFDGAFYLVFTRMPGWVTEGDSGFFCCVPCLSGSINSFSFFMMLNVCFRLRLF